MALRPEDERPGPIGIFGGSFDPPHIGHVTVAGDVARALSLDRLFWVPARVPPHKRDRRLTDDETRLEMVGAAVAGHPGFAVHDLELRRPGPSYTVDTVRELARDHGGVGIYLVLGVDQLRTFATGWKDPVEILRWATLAAMDRDGSSTLDVLHAIPGMERTVHVPVTRVDVSSSEIRARVAAGRDIGGLVPEGVAEIIRREDLYRA